MQFGSSKLYLEPLELSKKNPIYNKEGKMKKSTSSGVFQLPNGTWGFRYAYWIDGKQKDIKRYKDENGNPFKTERAAMKAREVAIIQAQAELIRPPKSAVKRMTVAEVFAEYCENGRCLFYFRTPILQLLPQHFEIVRVRIDK